MLNKDHSLLFTLLINLGLSLTILPLAQAEMVEHVVIISFDGLRPDALTILGAANLPTFYKIIQEGASTLNARSDYDETETLPNHATMLTGRGVMGANGHRHSGNEDIGQTLHSIKGSYVHSLFDVAHDYGLKTALLASKDKFAVYSRSYDGINGAPDVIGIDNGQKKIDMVALTEKVDSITLSNFISTMTTSSQPPQLTFLHFCGPDKTGHTSATGWDVTPGSAYMNTIKQMDDYLQDVLDNVPPKTVVIATADHGGGQPLTTHVLPDKPVNYTIPFLVWDNMGITQPNSDLYNLNPNDYADPGTARPDYTQAQQPIRNGDVANFALSLLCLPNIPGSFIKGKLVLNNYANRAPLLANSSTLNLNPINEEDINNTGMVVADLITGLITDPDFSCTLEGIAVIAVDNSNGHWEYSTNAGSSWNPFGNPSSSDARLLASDTQIRFIPNANYYGQASITFRAWDQTSGSHGSTADATTSGDPTAFSSNAVIASITVNAINDAPSFTAGSNQTQVAGSSGIQTISQWATAIDSGASNENSQNLTFQITIISDPDDILVIVPTIDNNTGDLNYTLTGNSGTAQLEVVLQDDGGTTLGGIDTSSPTAFTITVGASNSTPPTNSPPIPTTPAILPIPNPISPSTPGLQPLPRTMRLVVSFRGNGKGRVTTEPQGIDCDNNDDSCEQTYETASWVKLTPIAAPGSKFSFWGGQSDCDNGEVFMSGPRLCEAYFDLLPVTLTVTPIDNSTITSYPQGIICDRHSEQCSHPFRVGTNITLTVTPAAGWQLAGWEGDCDETGQITLMADKQCQPILVPIPATSTEVNGLDETMPLIAIADIVSAKPLITLTEEAVTTSLPTVETSVITREIPVVIIEKEAPPSLSIPTIASTVVTSVPFDKPICPTAGWLDWVCNAQKQIITHLEIGPNGNLSNGILTETINSQGWTSNLVIQPQATLTGGIVTGYINNQGTMTDFIFRGALIQGGILAGTVMNDSPIDGVIKDVQLAAGTYLNGGRWGGNITGEADAPALLEHLTIVTGSYLNHVVIGEEVELVENVTLGEDVHFISAGE
jgi:Type I phosphodiesterase / nucleotide pyrophosphatase/Divergent InlB B-repeat domain